MAQIGNDIQPGFQLGRPNFFNFRVFRYNDEFSKYN